MDEVEAPQGGQVCPNCGGENASSMKFCNSCGHDLEPAGEGRAHVAPVANGAEEASPPDIPVAVGTDDDTKVVFSPEVTSQRNVVIRARALWMRIPESRRWPVGIGAVALIAVIAFLVYPKQASRKEYSRVICGLNYTYSTRMYHYDNVREARDEVKFYNDVVHHLSGIRPPNGAKSAHEQMLRYAPGAANLYREYADNYSYDTKDDVDGGQEESALENEKPVTEVLSGFSELKDEGFANCHDFKDSDLKHDFRTFK